MGTCTTTHLTKDSVSGWVWDAESKLQLAVRRRADGMIAQAAGQSAASATLKSCFSCREEDDIEITYSTHSKDLIIHLKRGSLLCFPTAVANLWDQAKANTDVEIIYGLFSLKAADPLTAPSLLVQACYSHCSPQDTHWRRSEEIQPLTRLCAA